MSDEEEISRIERDSLTEGYIPSADAGWLIDNLRSAREDGARLDAFEQLVDGARVGVTVYPKRHLPRIWVDFTSWGPRDGSLRDALDVIRNDTDLAAPTGRETGNE